MHLADIAVLCAHGLKQTRAAVPNDVLQPRVEVSCLAERAHPAAKLCVVRIVKFRVAFASGFTSASHFSKCYRDMFGRTPRAERRGPGVSAEVRAAGEADAFGDVTEEEAE